MTVGPLHMDNASGRVARLFYKLSGVVFLKGIIVLLLYCTISALLWYASLEKTYSSSGTQFVIAHNPIVLICCSSSHLILVNLGQ